MGLGGKGSWEGESLNTNVCLLCYKMESKKFDIRRVKTQEKKIKVLSVRVTKKDFEWIKKNRISATRLFNYALHKVMKEEKER